MRSCLLICMARSMRLRRIVAKIGFACLLVPILFVFSAQAQKRVPVDLELILMADGSGSVDDLEFLIQRQGYAKALSHPDIWHGIRNGILRQITLSYVECSAPNYKSRSLTGH